MRCFGEFVEQCGDRKRNTKYAAYGRHRSNNFAARRYWNLKIKKARRLHTLCSLKLLDNVYNAGPFLNK